MQDFKERFSQKTQRELEGLYIPYYDWRDADAFEFIPIVPVKELTIDNFGILTENGILTAENFRWYEEDGSDRDFKYDDSDNYICSNTLPKEVSSLLNTVICIKFATQKLKEVKSMLKYVTDKHVKKEFNKSFSAFQENTNNSREKLTAAVFALRYAALVPDFHEDDFNNAAEVIDEVLSEI